MPSKGVLSQAHYAVIVFVGSTVLRGVQDGPEVGVVGSAVDADCDALSGHLSDSPGRSPHGAAASVSGGHLADRGALKRPAPVFPKSSHVLAVCVRPDCCPTPVRYLDTAAPTRGPTSLVSSRAH